MEETLPLGTLFIEYLKLMNFITHNIFIRFSKYSIEREQRKIKIEKS